MFLVNSSVGSLAAASIAKMAIKTAQELCSVSMNYLDGSPRQTLGKSPSWRWRQSLFQSYGRFFAEFLSDGSLVGLSLLDPSTGVGLRYGRQKHKFTIFSGQNYT